jgi:hypothetical protein
MLRASKPENGIREFKIEQALTFNIFALITMPLAVEVEKRKFAQAQQLAVVDVAAWPPRLAKLITRHWPPKSPCGIYAKSGRQPRQAPNWHGAWRRWAISANYARHASRPSMPMPLEPGQIGTVGNRGSRTPCSHPGPA